MSEDDFIREVKVISFKMNQGELCALDAGRLYHKLCLKYLENHESLPEGYV